MGDRWGVDSRHTFQAWLWEENTSDQDDECRVCRGILVFAVAKNTIPFSWCELFFLVARQTTPVNYHSPKSTKASSFSSTPVASESAQPNALTHTVRSELHQQEERHRAVDYAWSGGELNPRRYADTKETYVHSQDRAFQASRALRNRDDGRWTHWPAGEGQDDVIAWFFKSPDALLGPARTKQYYSSRDEGISGSTSYRKVDIFLLEAGRLTQ